MADIRCPSCGKNNPDFLDNCQFCQTPLKPESMVHTGESPVKKNTGELEPILPQWLKDVRQQGRESAAEDAAEEAAKPKVQKNEPPDLLAGLASQAKDDEEEIPDWLRSINPVTQPSPAASSAPPPESDFFAQFGASEPASPEPQASEPAQENIPSWMAGSTEAPPAQAAQEKDELSEWFAKASAESSAPMEVESDLPEWTSPSESPSYAFKEPPPQPRADEDLSWLRSLEESSKEEAAPTQQQPSESQSELSWLNDLGDATSDVPPGRPAADEPPTWVRKMGGVEAGAPPRSPEPAEEKPAESNPIWLQNVEEEQGSNVPPEKVSPFTRPTGPLRDVIADDSMPEWLTKATEEPSMPAPGALSDWFRETDLAPLPAPSPDSDASNVSTPSSSDVDSLLSVDLPDWLARPEPDSAEAPSKPRDDSLAPVDLPSWVQAMRPAESAVPGVPRRASQPTESEGPLAGLEGVIPTAPIGSSRKPKTISLKLQATDEQHAGAALLEKILASETTARPIVTQANIASQRALRWALSGLFLVVLGAMAFMRTVSMPISASLPLEVQSVSSTIARLPQSPLVLVVMDYEPALAGEMEAVSGPMLDQLASATRARLVFISTSPNSTALVRRLLTNTGISTPIENNGLAYKAGENYINLGYLPGGYTGVREFLESPTTVLPQAGQVVNFSVGKFTDYAAVIVLTDHAESGRVWVEQLYARNRADATFFSVQPVLFAASAQAGPMLQPYYDSQQITGLVNGLADAARYEYVNSSRPGTARRYWDSFGVGLLMATAAIVLGSLWSLAAGLRARRSGEAG
jgi:hypothetical protein